MTKGQSIDVGIYILLASNGTLWKNKNSIIDDWKGPIPKSKCCVKREGGQSKEIARHYVLFLTKTIL